jgi:hypothetical protein
MNRLYQWLRGRTSTFISAKSAGGTSRTVCTEVTVQRQSMTLLVAGAATIFDVCPLCGQSLAPAQAEHARRRLREGSISQEDLPVDESPAKKIGSPAEAMERIEKQKLGLTKFNTSFPKTNNQGESK